MTTRGQPVSITVVKSTRVTQVSRLPIQNTRIALATICWTDYSNQPAINVGTIKHWPISTIIFAIASSELQLSRIEPISNRQIRSCVSSASCCRKLSIIGFTCHVQRSAWPVTKVRNRYRFLSVSHCTSRAEFHVMQLLHQNRGFLMQPVHQALMMNRHLNTDATT